MTEMPYPCKDNGDVMLIAPADDIGAVLLDKKFGNNPNFKT